MIPEISVVMSVFNGAGSLRKSVESILTQEGVDFEFVIVNDGSIDESGKILAEYADRDKRIRIIDQENAGLTMALIRGCAEAKGDFIARQDVGDISYAGRLRTQLSCFKSNPAAALVSCGTRYSGPDNEFLYDVMEAKDKLSTQLGLIGPSCHPCTMFSKSVYEHAGGYRRAFYFGQDRDLWPRLCALGEHIIIPEVLYEASVTIGSITGLYRKEQDDIALLIAECNRLRQAGLSETPALEKAAKIRPDLRRRRSNISHAKALYFIASCLQKKGDPRARGYFKRAIKIFPFHFRSWYRIIKS